MGRRVKYENEQTKMEAAALGARVIKEMREGSGLTLSALSQYLERHCIPISEGLIKQYSSAQKPIGSRRLSELATFAFSKGWGAENCLKVMLFYDHERNEAFKAKQEKLIQRRAKLAGGFVVCVKDMVDAGVDFAQIRNLLEVALSKAEIDLAKE